MPRYFFHNRNGRSERDGDGVELADETAARTEAVRALGQALEDEAGDFWRTSAVDMIVTNDAGRTLFSLQVRGLEPPAGDGG